MYALSPALTLLAALLAQTQRAAATGTTPLIKTYAGSSFLDGWTYFGTYDNTTNGDVNYVNSTIATSSPTLTYTTPQNTTILRVDNTSTVAYNDKRNSFKIYTDETYSIGSVWVLDALHVPYGCSVWPGFWSYGPEGTWPSYGEIDVFEGVNLQPGNQMALHTEDGCTLTGSSFTGTINSTTCNYAIDGNAGCGIIDPAGASYGADFASAGGGVWVTEFASSGISIWFFSRADVPSAISQASGQIDTSGLGTPVAFWSSGGCEIEKFFGAQRLVFDITLCGDWAGQSSVLESTGCSALTDGKTCYTTYVLDASNYDEAYFEINSLKVYSNSSATTSTSSSSSSNSSSSSSEDNASSGALKAVARSGWAGAGAGVIVTLAGLALTS